MATTLNNLHKNPPFHSQFLKNNHIHNPFKLIPSSPFKFPSTLKSTKVKCTSPPKPFLKPSNIQATNPFNGFEPLFFGGGWMKTTGPTRGDVRAWSGRRAGSKSGGKKNRVIIALECTNCAGNRYITEKRRVARTDTRSEKKKEDKKVKTGEGLLLSKYCPKCRKHFLHKEVKIGTPK